MTSPYQRMLAKHKAALESIRVMSEKFGEDHPVVIYSKDAALRVDKNLRKHEDFMAGDL